MDTDVDYTYAWLPFHFLCFEESRSYRLEQVENSEELIAKWKERHIDEDRYQSLTKIITPIYRKGDDIVQDVSPHQSIIPKGEDVELHKQPSSLFFKAFTKTVKHYHTIEQITEPFSNQCTRIEESIYGKYYYQIFYQGRAVVPMIIHIIWDIALNKDILKRYYTEKDLRKIVLRKQPDTGKVYAFQELMPIEEKDPEASIMPYEILSTEYQIVGNAMVPTLETIEGGERTRNQGPTLREEERLQWRLQRAISTQSIELNLPFSRMKHNNFLVNLNTSCAQNWGLYLRDVLSNDTQMNKHLKNYFLDIYSPLKIPLDYENNALLEQRSKELPTGHRLIIRNSNPIVFWPLFQEETPDSP